MSRRCWGLDVRPSRCQYVRHTPSRHPFVCVQPRPWRHCSPQVHGTKRFKLSDLVPSSALPTSPQTPRWATPTTRRASARSLERRPHDRRSDARHRQGPASLGYKLVQVGHRPVTTGDRREGTIGYFPVRRVAALTADCVEPSQAASCEASARCSCARTSRSRASGSARDTLSRWMHGSAWQPEIVPSSSTRTPPPSVAVTPTTLRRGSTSAATSRLIAVTRSRLIDMSNRWPLPAVGSTEWPAN